MDVEDVIEKDCTSVELASVLVMCPGQLSI